MNTVDIKTFNYNNVFTYVDNLIDLIDDEYYASGEEGTIEIRRLPDGRFQVSVLFKNRQGDLFE